MFISRPAQVGGFRLLTGVFTPHETAATNVLAASPTPVSPVIFCKHIARCPHRAKGARAALHGHKELAE